MNGALRNSQSLAALEEDALGDPMTIAEVAELLGCSPWKIRQHYLSQGLPYLRANAGGKLIFFR